MITLNIIVLMWIKPFRFFNQRIILKITGAKKFLVSLIVVLVRTIGQGTVVKIVIHLNLKKLNQIYQKNCFKLNRDNTELKENIYQHDHKSKIDNSLSSNYHTKTLEPTQLPVIYLGGGSNTGFWSRANSNIHNYYK